MNYCGSYADSLFLMSKSNWIVGTEIVLNVLCIVSVNVYVLMSGYFLSQKTFSFQRLLRLLFQVLFYTVLIPLILAIVGVLPLSRLFNVYHLWNSIFPTQSGHYWFVSAYVLMMLFSPIMNLALENLKKRQLELMLLLLLMFFCVGKSLSPLQFATDRYV